MRPVASVTMTPMDTRLETRTTVSTVRVNLGFLLILGKTIPVPTEDNATAAERIVMGNQTLGKHAGHAGSGGSTVSVKASV